MKRNALQRKEHALYMRDYNTRARKAVIALLGDKCIKCGFSDWRALQLDHITQRSREENKERSLMRYLQILKGKRPISDFQLLCANCNTLKVWENEERKRAMKY